MQRVALLCYGTDSAWLFAVRRRHLEDGLMLQQDLQKNEKARGKGKKEMQGDQQSTRQTCYLASRPELTTLGSNFAPKASMRTR